MKIKFIGTGSGKVDLSRFHAALMLSSEDQRLLIDAGDSITRAMLCQNEIINRIDSILITHFHPDHIAGLPLLLLQMKMEARKCELSLHVHLQQLEDIQDYLRLNLVFPERLGFKLNILPFNFNEAFTAGQFSIVAYENTHLEKYSSENGFKGVSSSFLIKDKIHSLLYTGDLGRAGDLYPMQIDGVGTLITEMIHVDLAQIINHAKNKNIPKIIITHVDSELLKGLFNVIENDYFNIKEKIIIAYDGLEI